MNLEMVHDRGFITARVTGHFSLQGANDALVRLFSEVAEQEATHVLVDCTLLQGSITTVEAYDHAAFAAEQLIEFSKLGFPLSTRFAYVTTGAFIDPTRFAEDVAVNRGLIVKVFENVEEALVWLG